MALETMEDLLVHELRDLLNAEKQLVKGLPKMAKAATDENLVQALEGHLEETKEHVARLEKCFDHLGMAARGKKCAGMEGLLSEATDIVDECEDDDVCNAAIIGAAQRVEHYEIAAYGTARAYAKQLGMNDIASLLEETLNEESAANEVLTDIAEGRVNASATSEDETDTAARRRDARQPDPEARAQGNNGRQRGSAVKPTKANRAPNPPNRQQPRSGRATR